MRGVIDKSKRKSIFETYRKRADILILQETHSSEQAANIWKNEWGGEIIFNHGTNMARGIAILLKKGMLSHISNVYKDEQGRTIIFDYEEKGVIVSIAAIYAPNEDRPNYFINIGNEIRKRSEHKIIIGDFNLTLDVDMDRKNTYTNNNNAKQEVENLMDEFTLRDVWRVQNEEKREYSWFKTNENLSKASRIDFALVSAGLDQKAKAITYLASIMSDHRPLYMVVETQQEDRGSGYWKLNTQYLHDQDYINLINDEIKKVIGSVSQSSDINVWEKIKVRIKKASVEYARKKVSENNLVISALSEKVNEYQSNFPLNLEEDKLCQETLKELEDRILEKTKGMIFRSKVRWQELGEKSTKYFFSMEKTRYNAKTCYKLLNEEGEEVTESQQILKMQEIFYQKLYSIDEEVNFTLKNTTGIKVPEEIRMEQEKQISMKDLQQAIKLMNNNKTPGQDGIPVDFYKVFWNQLKQPFMNMLQEVYQSEKLHTTAREGILNLIPKQNKDTRRIQNLRPITLLNTDYKIIEKCIANKMLPALEKIINQDQRGFMKDRRI